RVFAVGICIRAGHVVFDIAYLAYLPTLVGQGDIVEANNKATTSFSVSALVGPGLGGVLVQLIGAARAIGVNAISYVVSVATLLWIEQPEPRPHPREEGSSFAGELREGLRLVFPHPLLASLV